MRWICIVLLGMGVVLSGMGVQADDTPRLPESGKKLIEYGWDVPVPEYIEGHIREMEQRPFDGIIFKLQGGNNVFDPVVWDKARYQRDFEALPLIQWQKFTDNFILMLAASNQDWFNDAHWKAIEKNTRLIARAARLSHCTGICFDAEPYGVNPWTYTKAVHRDAKSFTAYQVIARKRGAQFIQAIEKELPNPTLLTFFLDSVCIHLCGPMPEALRVDRLSKHAYALLPAFLEGMLEGSGKGTLFVDGNEDAYYYTNSLSYFEAYHGIRNRVKALVAPEYWRRYCEKVQVGQALYVDQYYGLRKAEETYGNFMPSEDQQKWFEHNAYWALYTTEKYVWCYSEEMNWWTDKNIPPGSEQALRNAVSTLASGRALKFDLQPIVGEAKRRERALNRNHLVRRSTDVMMISEKDTPPVIDGDLQDLVWQKVMPLEPFVPLLSRGKEAKVEAQTEVRMAYDNKAVYFSFICHEPRIDLLKSTTDRNNDIAMFSGDVIEVFVCMQEKESQFIHFAVNPKGATWSSVNRGCRDEVQDVLWSHATHIGEKEWTVEMAIPWKTLGYPMPSLGLALRANFGRERAQNSELSAWRSMERMFLEPENFGQWLF